MVYFQFQVMDLIFFNKKNLLLQTKFAAETDATSKPDFHWMPEWKMYAPG